MNSNEINDKRIQKDFQGITFSKYKKSDAKKQLISYILDGKIEESNYWTCEFICAGHYLELWDIILLIISKHIYCANPKLPLYIEMRIQNFREIVSNGYIENELLLRNNDKIRKLFAEIVSVLCFSKKKPNYQIVKINKKEFDLTELTHRLKADSLSYVQQIFLKDDPKELFIALNEFMFNISKSQMNSSLACYWLEWIIDFESLCKKKKDKCVCERRAFINVDEKLQMDIIWMLWDGMLVESTKRSTIITKIMKTLLNLYTLRYTPAVKKKRKYIMYFAISILTENVNTQKNIIDDKEKIENIVSKIDNVYKQVKKNEIAPETDYLFNGIKENNLEKSLSKIEKMNTIDFVPRK
jgi:hypothetical protein